MRARTLAGREIELTPAVFEGLKSRLEGVMIVPGAAGYDEARGVWNGMIDRRPALVVRCLGNADVATCVRFAREHDLLLCVKGGG
ncbi:MAG TPA: hypothetical protein VK849_13510, partial [Longimicrobiales bacterium]|nr:hypothetical protein [Longimicrobiales bacterium]